MPRRVAHRMPPGCPSYEALPPSAAPSAAPQPSPPAPTSGAGAGTTRDHRAGNSSPWGPGRAWTFWRSSAFAQNGLRTFCPRAARGPDGARFQSDIFLTFLGHFKCQKNVQKMSNKCLSAWGSLPKCPKVVRPKPTRPDKCQKNVWAKPCPQENVKKMSGRKPVPTKMSKKCLGETCEQTKMSKQCLGEHLAPRKCQKNVWAKTCPHENVKQMSGRNLREKQMSTKCLGSTLSTQKCQKNVWAGCRRSLWLPAWLPSLASQWVFSRPRSYELCPLGSQKHRKTQ